MRPVAGVQKGATLPGEPNQKFYGIKASDRKSPKNGIISLDAYRCFSVLDSSDEEMERMKAKKRAQEISPVQKAELVISSIDKFLEQKVTSMTNEEFFKFIEQVNRALEVAYDSIDKNEDQIKRLSKEMLSRLETTMIPIELDVIGHYLSIMEKQRKFNLVQEVASAFAYKVKQAFAKNWFEIEERWKKVPFSRLAMIFNGLPPHASGPVLKMIDRKITDIEEPKPIAHI